MLVYHTGYQEIREPDVHFGRKNADFGQGFYLTRDGEFAGRWAKQRKDAEIHVNSYELSLEGLQVMRFVRDEAWFDYIRHNRAGAADRFPEADVILGPIANDTLYNTYGILTSGFLSAEQSLRLLRIGGLYEQIVLKTEKAASQLRWLSARIPEPGEIARYRALVRAEEEEYQKLFSEAMAEM